MRILIMATLSAGNSVFHMVSAQHHMVFGLVHKSYFTLQHTLCTKNNYNMENTSKLKLQIQDCVWPSLSLWIIETGWPECGYFKVTGSWSGYMVVCCWMCPVHVAVDYLAYAAIEHLVSLVPDAWAPLLFLLPSPAISSSSPPTL